MKIHLLALELLLPSSVPTSTPTPVGDWVSFSLTWSTHPPPLVGKKNRKMFYMSWNEFCIIIIIIIKKSAKSNRVQLWKTKFNNNGKLLMNHVVSAAAGLVLDQPSFFSTLLKKLILPPSVSILKFLLSHDRPLHSPRCSWVSRILSSQNLHSRSFDLVWLALSVIIKITYNKKFMIEYFYPFYSQKYSKCINFRHFIILQRVTLTI